jgi:hypothetical protein
MHELNARRVFRSGDGQSSGDLFETGTTARGNVLAAEDPSAAETIAAAG